MDSEKMLYGYSARTGVLTGQFPAQIDPLETKLRRRAALDVANEAHRKAALDKANAEGTEYKQPDDLEESALDGTQYQEPEPVYLMPAFSTDVPPPEAPEGQVPVFVDGEWTLKPDVLGKTVFEKATGAALIVDKFEDYDPATHTLDAPQPHQKWDKKRGWVQDDESLWAEVRDKRNFLLSASDWTQLPDSPLEPLQRTAWAAYRAKLRDLPQGAENDPLAVEWPAQPE